MEIYQFLSRRIIFPLTKRDPEVAHNLGLFALKILGKGKRLGLTEVTRELASASNPGLKQMAFGMTFQNPVGVAAGLDKYARGAVEGIYALGFGFHTFGSISREKQAGNKRPRIERHPERKAIINWKGLDNDGAEITGERLHRQSPPNLPVGISLAKSNATPIEEAPQDFLCSFKKMRAHADFIKVNISCPNSPGYRGLQQEELFKKVLGAIQEENHRHGRVVPILIKISPDPTWSDTVWNELYITIETAKEMGAVGIAGPNTTGKRYRLAEPYSKIGGYSGPDCFKENLKLMGFVREIWNKAIIIMSGGIFTPENAFEALKVANLIEVFTSFIYRGPLIAYRLNTGLSKLMEERGISSLSELRGLPKTVN